MTVNFLPGQPNDHPSSCSFANWNTIQILAYTSGNNLVILTKNSTHLQTIYLPSDSFIVDINRINGKIAICVDTVVYIYTPNVTNYFNFNFHGRKNIDELKIEWELEHTITNTNDNSRINCISWSDYVSQIDDDSEDSFLDLPAEFNSKTTCELIVGSDKSLTLHRLFYSRSEHDKNEAKCATVWSKNQPNPVYKVSFSPNASCIASVGYYDKNIKLWHRTGFTNEFCDFELHYIQHESFVTDIIWKKNLAPTDPNNRNLTDTIPTSNQTGSFVLKPVNSIIKNDTDVLSSRSSSIGSRSRRNQHNVLYTFTTESIMNVYSTFRSEKGFSIFRSGELDLYLDDPNKRETGVVKSVVFIDNEALELGLEKLLESLGKQSTMSFDKRRRSKISELISLKCELCIVIGNDGEMNIYALANLCYPVPTNISILKLNQLVLDETLYQVIIKLRKYCLPTNNKSYFLKGIQFDHYSDFALTLVIHDTFKNTIREVGFTFDVLLQFEKSGSSQKLNKPLSHKEIEIGFLTEKFTGHNKSVRTMVRSTDGSTILSISRFNENYLWRPIALNDDRTTISKSLFLTELPIIKAVIWKNGKFVFTMLENKLVAHNIIENNSDANVGNAVASLDVSSETCYPECMLILPESSTTCCHIIVILKNGNCESYEFITEGSTFKLAECQAQSLPMKENTDIHLISAINPVGWEKSIDMIGRDVLATVSKCGLVSIYYASLNNHEVKWHLKDSFKTGIPNCSFISGSSINQMAIVDETRSKLSIWDMKIGVLDYFEEFENEIIKDLDWTATENKQGILAVGFKSYALLFTQLRYDYTNRIDSFAKIKKIDISNATTHEIGDSIWMRDGLLVTGAGNQMYLSDKKLDLNNDIITNQAIGTIEIPSNDIFYLCSALNGPLPLYHPQFIIQLLLSGRNLLIKRILSELSTIVREVDLGLRREDDFRMNIDVEGFFNSLSKPNGKTEKELMNEMRFVDPDVDGTFDEHASDILSEKLNRIKIPLLTGHQQITLSHTVSIMKSLLLNYSKILDYNGLRFLLTMKLFTVNMTKGSKANTATIRNRDMTFALHSDNKDLLYDLILEEANGKIDWNIAKRYLLPYWLDRITLRKIIEKIAVNEFLKFQQENDGRKDPTTCSIFYLILKRKNVLLGLWKNSIGNGERDKMVKFLSNDFSEKRWRTAAMKNAYVLLGKHRYQDAVTFFLLADSPKDAVNVIIKNLNDIPLAVAVSRCYEESDQNESMKAIIERKTLNEAILNNDRWKISWIFWILGDKPNAAQSLIKPLHLIKEDIANLLPNFKWPNTDSVIRTSNTEDPVLLIMYNSLKSRKIDYYHGISQMDPKHEFAFIIKAATMYSKMGCDWLALDLVKKWKFSVPEMITQEKVTSPRKKPGDILSKFMSSDTPSNRSVSSLLEKSKRSSILDDYETKVMKSDNYDQPVNILDGFTQPANSRNMLDDFVQPEKAPKSMLDDFAQPSTSKNMLDDFTQPSTSTKMLDDFKPTPKKQPKPVSKPSTAPSMLDDWM